MAEMRRTGEPEVQQIDISRRPVQGRPAQGRPAQGRTTQGRPVQGRPAQGRTNQGRPVQDRTSRNGYEREGYDRGREQVRKPRRRKRQSGRGPSLVVVLLLVVLVIVAGVYLHGRVTKTYSLEAGETVVAEQLIVRGNAVPLIVKDLTEEERHTPGEYEISVRLAPFTHTVKVTVQDTTAPVAAGVSAFCKYGNTLPLEAFVTEVTDATDVTYAFETEPDFKKGGEQEVAVIYTDAAGNRTRVVSTLYVSNLVNEMVMEAGGSIPGPRAFLEDIPGFENTEVYYITDIGEIDTSVPGDYEISMLVDGRESLVHLIVEDTIAPVFTVKHIDGWTLKAIEPEMFVVSAQDATAVTYSFADEPDWTRAGSASAEVIAMDAAGNVNSQIVTFKLKEDTVAPEVSLSTIDIIIGEAVSYKKAVGYSDNADSKAELKLEIDNSKVDPNTVGTYKVTYTVTDTAGNSTTKTGEVYVMDKKPIYYDETVVNEKADEVLAQIIKDNMTPYEKTRAIYNWVHGKIGYISHSEKGDWVRGAYEGLVKRQGDCFVYACTAKVLLTRAGIENMDIVKSKVNPSHYWNLVNLGEGWYHFDATPRKDKTVFFMWTDAQLREYSESHKDTHIYDASLYPEIN